MNEIDKKNFLKLENLAQDQIGCSVEEWFERNLTGKGVWEWYVEQVEKEYESENPVDEQCGHGREPKTR